MKRIKAKVKEHIYKFKKGETVKIIQYVAIPSDSCNGGFDDAVLVARKNGDIDLIGKEHLSVNYKKI